MQDTSRKGISACYMVQTSSAFKMHFQIHTLEARKSCIPKSLLLFWVFSQITYSLGIYGRIFKNESKSIFKKTTSTS